LPPISRQRRAPNTYLQPEEAEEPPQIPLPTTTAGQRETQRRLASTQYRRFLGTYLKRHAIREKTITLHLGSQQLLEVTTAQQHAISSPQRTSSPHILDLEILPLSDPPASTAA
jgi:hypothetical protein